MKDSDLIEETVERFYKKATTDFLIGHHFRKIATKEGENPLAPPIEAFSHHLPRINLFWKTQLLGVTLEKNNPPFSLLEKHRPLKIKKGELDRWVILFQETLLEMEKKHSSKLWQKWEKKIEHFKSIFHN